MNEWGFLVPPVREREKCPACGHDRIVLTDKQGKRQLVRCWFCGEVEEKSRPKQEVVV